MNLRHVIITRISEKGKGLAVAFARPGFTAPQPTTMAFANSNSTPFFGVALNSRDSSARGSLPLAETPPGREGSYDDDDPGGKKRRRNRTTLSCVECKRRKIKVSGLTRTGPQTGLPAVFGSATGR
jgi:hypothetical protein